MGSSVPVAKYYTCVSKDPKPLISIACSLRTKLSHELMQQGHYNPAKLYDQGVMWAEDPQRHSPKRIHCITASNDLSVSSQFQIRNCVR